jgi:hypothetical protein
MEFYVDVTHRVSGNPLLPCSYVQAITRTWFVRNLTDPYQCAEYFRTRMVELYGPERVSNVNIGLSPAGRINALSGALRTERKDDHGI